MRDGVTMNPRPQCWVRHGPFCFSPIQKAEKCFHFFLEPGILLWIGQGKRKRRERGIVWCAYFSQIVGKLASWVWMCKLRIKYAFSLHPTHTGSSLSLSFIFCKRRTLFVSPLSSCIKDKEIMYTLPFALCLLCIKGSIQGMLANNIAVVRWDSLPKCKVSQCHWRLSSKSPRCGYWCF